MIERARDARTAVSDLLAKTDSSADNEFAAGIAVEVPQGQHTIVVAGADAGPLAEEIAHAGGWPLIAEVTSGARFGRNLIVHYRDALAEPELSDRIERVIVCGHVTLSRQVPALLERPGIEVVRVARGDEVTVMSGDLDGTDGVDGGDGGWLRTWQRWDRAAQESHAQLMAQQSPAARAPDIDVARSRSARDQREFVEGELAASRAPITRELLVGAVWRATWPHDRLVFGASRLIRVADATVPGKKISVHANRGLSGIDGNIGTAVGIALAAQPALTRIVLGDIAALHDAGSMLFPVGEERPRIQVIVGNDGGGTIFDVLEVAKTARRSTFDRVMFTPQDVRFEQLAAAYGWRYTRVATVGELESALIGASGEPELVDVVLAR